MNKPFFKVKKQNNIIIQTESVKSVLFQTGVGLVIVSTIPWCSYIIADGLSYSAKIFEFMFTFFALIVLLSSFYFKSVNSVFNSNTGEVTFNSSKLTFKVPFNTVRFVTNRIPTGRGVSSVIVSVYAVSEKPLHPQQKTVGEPHFPLSQYETILCTYKCGSQEEADESINQLRRFMGELPPEPEESSKFDKLI